MIKLRKYIQPYIFAIVLAIVLLFCQGYTELYLPNLMSDIVNVGIQGSGIEHNAPNVISSDGMKLLTGFMPPSSARTVLDNYTLIEPSSAQYRSYQKDYDYLNGKNSLYVLNSDVQNREQLDEAFSKAGLAMMFKFKDLSGQMGGNSAQNADMSNLDTDSIDLSKLYAFSGILTMDAQKDIEQADQADATTYNSVGTVIAKLMYNEVGVDVGQMQMNYIFRVGLKMIVVTLIGVIAAIIVSLIAAKVSAAVARTLRRDIFAKVESFSNNEFDQFSTASLITRTTNDVTQIQNVINMTRMVFYAPILGIGGIILAASTTMALSGVIIGATVALFIVLGIVLAIAQPKFKLIQKFIDRLNLVTRESLSGILVIRAFGTEKHEEERFDKANKDLTRVNLFVNRVMTFLMPIMMLVMNIVSILIVWFGSHLIADGNMQIGDMMAFIQYAMMIIMSFLMIGAIFIIFPRASVSAGRIAEILEKEASVKDPENPKSLPSTIDGELTFHHVSFRYANADSDVLTDIDFTAKPGQTTAFIGSTGSGKSTLVNLIPRFYDVTEGSITLDGIDIRELTQHDLREQIGFVPQKATLFSGNIDSNLRYGRKNATDREIETAVSVAQAEEFVSQQPDKYQSPIAQGGTNVSGGQKQRLAIARALVRKAAVYVFDDSFSALDFKTDAALRKALKKYTDKATVIIVAQRISTIMHAEQIIVLDEGRIVGQGTHNELLKTCDTYREIAVSQNSAQEI